MTSLFVGFAGFAVGLLLFSSVLRWLATVGDIVIGRANVGGQGKLPRILLATFLGSGFWLLLVAAWVGYFVRAETWFMPLCVGAIVALLYQVAVLAWVVRMRRHEDKNDAA